MINLLYSEVEDDLRGAVRSVLRSRSPWGDVLARTETAKTYDLDLWRMLAGDLGLAGLIVPEELGGAGASYREAAVVCEELGRAVAPVPFLGSAVVATTALLACDQPALVAAVASGERTAALVAPFSDAVVTPAVTTRGDHLTGTVTSVADALPADLLLVPTAEGLFAVESSAATVTAVTSFDMTRQLADIALDNAPGTLIAAPDVARPAIADALTAGAAMLASEQLGIAEWCLDTTVDYLKTRYQFGRLIGSYQALKHRVADVYVDVAQARAVARYAADCAARGDADLPVAVAVAQAFNAPTAVRAAEECVQLHGGIGFTWEYPVHLYLKRAKTTAIAYGSAASHRADLAALVDLPS
jgi:alkylation response protein AidB-like acyl-CoA dehydrogenase